MSAQILTPKNSRSALNCNDNFITQLCFFILKKSYVEVKKSKFCVNGSKAGKTCDF